MMMSLLVLQITDMSTAEYIYKLMWSAGSGMQIKALHLATAHIQTVQTGDRSGDTGSFLTGLLAFKFTNLPYLL